MAGEIKSIKDTTRRVKQKALELAEDILNNPDKYDRETYNQTYLTVLKNSVPRTQEITGEEGTPVRIVFDPAFKTVADATS